jgi:hypothetical protein
MCSRNWVQCPTPADVDGERLAAGAGECFMNEGLPAGHSPAHTCYNALRAAGDSGSGGVWRWLAKALLLGAALDVHWQVAADFGRKPHLDERRHGVLLLVRRRAGDVQVQQLLQVFAIARYCVSALARVADVLEHVHLGA